MGKTIRNPYVEEAIKRRAGIHPTYHKQDRKRGGARNRTQELLDSFEEETWDDEPNNKSETS
jgi:hypothetical protein